MGRNACRAVSGDVLSNVGGVEGLGSAARHAPGPLQAMTFWPRAEISPAQRFNLGRTDPKCRAGPAHLGPPASGHQHQATSQESFMPDQKTVAVLVGSLRKDSLSRKVAQAIATLAPDTLRFDFVDIGSVSHFNQDLEATPPADWVAFRDRVAAADAVLFVTPEYNRSIPGVLKNALD